MSHIIQIYKGKRGGWYLRIVAKNGKIVADGGEGYSTKSNAIRAARRLSASICSAKLQIV